MNDNNNDIVKELIPKYLAGEASVEEEKELFEWVAQAPENERDYSDIKKIFTLSQKHYADSAAENLPVNIDEEWNTFIKTINKPEARSIQIPVHTENTFGLWYKIAAAILLLVASGVVINYFTSNQPDVRYATAENTLNVTLPDGTAIILNQHSELSYKETFGEQNRTVTLKGEGFFDVAHNKSKPFIIHVNDAIVEVVGTSFNVSAYNKYKKVEVVVKTGVVKLLVPAIKSEVILQAGQKGVYVKNEQQISRAVNDDVNFLSWNTRKIIFEENNLQTVIETLNKIYQANIVIATEIPESCEVTVTFDHQTLDAVMHVLETTLNLQYELKGNQIEITRAGC